LPCHYYIVIFITHYFRHFHFHYFITDDYSLIHYWFCIRFHWLFLRYFIDIDITLRFHFIFLLMPFIFAFSFSIFSLSFSLSFSWSFSRRFHYDISLDIEFSSHYFSPLKADYFISPVDWYLDYFRLFSFRYFQMIFDDDISSFLRVLFLSFFFHFIDTFSHYILIFSIFSFHCPSYYFWAAIFDSYWWPAFSFTLSELSHEGLSFSQPQLSAYLTCHVEFRVIYARYFHSFLSATEALWQLSFLEANSSFIHFLSQHI
jgi:hypothetical protein